MLCRLVEQHDKPITQVVLGAAAKRGAPIEGGEYFIDVPKNYDGINAVVEPKEADFENIASGARVNRIPTRVGERYATTELTVGSLTAGDAIVVSSGKFVAAGASTAYNWIYGGVYNNPYGLTMYIVEKVPAATTAAG